MTHSRFEPIHSSVPTKRFARGEQTRRHVAGAVVFQPHDDRDRIRAIAVEEVMRAMLSRHGWDDRLLRMTIADIPDLSQNVVDLQPALLGRSLDPAS